MATISDLSKGNYIRYNGDILQIEQEAWAYLLSTLETNTKLNPVIAIWIREEHPEFFDCIRYAPEQLFDS